MKTNKASTFSVLENRGILFSMIFSAQIRLFNKCKGLMYVTINGNKMPAITYSIIIYRESIICKIDIGFGVRVWITGLFSSYFKSEMSPYTSPALAVTPSGEEF